MKIPGLPIWAALLLVFLATGCGQGGPREGATETTASSITESEATLQEETTSQNADGPSFTAAPEMSGGLKGAADGILGVRLEEREGYERAVVDFGLGDSPAPRVPAWSLSSPTGEGYARIALPDVDTTSISDGSLDGSILDDFYVVRAPGGGLFVDVFATGAFQYRVMEFPDPGRLVIDYRPADVALAFPLPARSERTVLFEPREGEAVTGPLRVSGYSRNFEASNTIVLVDPNGNALLQSTVLSNDWLDTWGYFEASLELPPFEGQATLRAGAESARDGSFEGVEAPVVYGGG